MIKKFLHQIMFIEIVQGLYLTLKHLIIKKPITFQYPHQKRDLPDGYRGILVHLRYDDGSEKCVGCSLCEAACPSRCIKVISDEVNGNPLQRYAKEYIFDLSKCVFCAFCVAACPVDALAMSKFYEYSTYNKRDLILNKQKMLEMGDRAFPVRQKRFDISKKHLNIFNLGKKGFPPVHQG